MAQDQEFDPGTREVPGRRLRRRDEYDDEYREIHAPGGSLVVQCPVTVVGGGGGGKKRRRKDGPDNPEIPATLPLTGNETLTIKQPIDQRPYWTRAYISILTLIRQFWPASWSWSGLNLKADTPITVLFTVPARDMVYQLVYSIACKVAGAGSGSVDLTINFVSLDGTASPITASSNLTTVGSGASVSTTVLLGAGTGVSFQAINAGAYDLGATYDLIVSAIPLCSDQGSNQADNLMI